MNQGINLDPALFPESPCCGRACTVALAEQESKGLWHVRMEFWADRHDRHVWVRAARAEDVPAAVHQLAAI